MNPIDHKASRNPEPPSAPKPALRPRHVPLNDLAALSGASSACCLASLSTPFLTGSLFIRTFPSRHGGMLDMAGITSAHKRDVIASAPISLPLSFPFPFSCSHRHRFNNARARARGKKPTKDVTAPEIPLSASGIDIPPKCIGHARNAIARVLAGR